jgi:thiol-disulfide isomerase/thioredoxin
MATEAPEFPHQAATDWINSAPLTLASLRGSVVLVEFWTFDCYNCRNTLPWLKSIHAEYGSRGLKVVSVHTPELEQERNPANVRAAVKELGITYPVMIDGDHSYWRAMKNRYCRRSTWSIGTEPSCSPRSANCTAVTSAATRWNRGSRSC